jgi:ketosteroid isomerase-like protein
VYFDEEVVKAQLSSGPADRERLAARPPTARAPQVIEHRGTPEETANVATLRAMLRALEEAKEADFLSTMADDVEVFTLDSSEPVRGKDAARAHFRNLRKSIRLLDTVIQNAWGVQSFVILEYGIAGLQVAQIPRVAFVEDRPLHAQFADVAELHEGKITRIWRYADPFSFGLPMTVSSAKPSDANLESRASLSKGARQ